MLTESKHCHAVGNWHPIGGEVRPPVIHCYFIIYLLVFLSFFLSSFLFSYFFSLRSVVFVRYSCLLLTRSMGSVAHSFVTGLYYGLAVPSWTVPCRIDQVLFWLWGWASFLTAGRPHRSNAEQRRANARRVLLDSIERRSKEMSLSVSCLVVQTNPILPTSGIGSQAD